MRFLLLQDADEGTRDRVAFSLESVCECTVTQVMNFADAICEIQAAKVRNEPYDLMVCDLSKATVLQYEDFMQKASSTKMILCTEGSLTREPPVEWNVIAVVDRRSLISNLLESVKRFATANGGTQQKPGYCKIRTKILLSVIPLKGDIFIRLSDTHYVKLFHQGDQFENSDLQKYTVKKGVEYLYLKTEDTKEFIDKYNTELQRYLSKSYTLNLDEAAKINDSIYETVQEMGKQMGFTKDVQTLARTQVRMAVKAIGKNPNLEALMSKLQTHKGDYLASHSTLTGYIACAIASHMEWGSEATFHKLTLAAFLHDITLDDAELAKHDTTRDARAAGLPSEVIDDYKKHAQAAAAIARNFTEVPPDVDVIIVQHHEQPDGTGFPRGMNHTNISPLTAVFAVAHDLAKFTLSRGTADFKIDDFLNQVREKYSSSKHRKVIQAIEVVFRSGGSAAAA